MSWRKRLLLWVGSLLISSAGISLIVGSEGVRYTAYPDPGTHGAPYTICYGHTHGVHKGDKATPSQCAEYLAEDTAVAEAGLKRVVKVPLRQGEYDAYTDLIFNVGITAFAKSNTLKMLNRGEHTAACHALPTWNKQMLYGIKVRRGKEEASCLLPGPTIWSP